MTAQLIDGIALSAQLRADVATRDWRTQGARHHTRPGRDPGRRQPGQRRSMCATRSRPAPTPACTRCWKSTTPTLTEAELLARIAALNADPAIHGILVQMPLPTHIDAAQGDRGHFARQGRGRLCHVCQRRRTDDRAAGLPALHALWLHEDARKHRASTCAANMRWSSAAATSWASPWPCCCCRPTPPSPSATAPPPTSATTRARPTSSSPPWASATCSPPTWSSPARWSSTWA